MAVVLTLCAAAVPAGIARSPRSPRGPRDRRVGRAIAGWAADVPATCSPGCAVLAPGDPVEDDLWRVVTRGDAPAASPPTRPMGLLAVAVNCKTVRGAVDTDGAEVHLMIAATHGDHRQHVASSIAVPDSSTDGSRAVARSYFQNGRVHVQHRPASAVESTSSIARAAYLRLPSSCGNAPARD